MARYFDWRRRHDFRRHGWHHYDGGGQDQGSGFSLSSLLPFNLEVGEFGDDDGAGHQEGEMHHRHRRPSWAQYRQAEMSGEDGWAFGPADLMAKPHQTGRWIRRDGKIILLDL